MDFDVGVGRRFGGELAQNRQKPRRGEVPDLVVGDAQVENDLLEPAAALAGQLDLDRGLLRCVQDAVGEVRAPFGAGREALGERTLALPATEPELLFEEEANVGDGLDVLDEAVVGLPGADAAAGDARAAARKPDKRRQLDREPGRVRPAGRTPAIA